ncbi:MAG: hypothetical protein SOZ89_04670 [Peptoniphilaceae bacterium]|nr:hypothetical protein [Peptoniphilaceae bacterium]MDD7383175.1 hypothetical protein [Peptoniphilaceae bacterium]MDY3738399.1 hypothetical protein [Peptoniphilaceae bacterium]
MFKKDFGNIPNKDKVRFFFDKDLEKNNDILKIKKLSIMAELAKNMAFELKLDEDICYSFCALICLNENYKETYKKYRENSYFALADSVLYFYLDSSKEENKDFFILKKENEYDRLNMFLYDCVNEKEYIRFYSYFSEKLNKEIYKYIKINKNKFPYNII